MKTYSDTLDDQIRAFRMVESPQTFRDDQGMLVQGNARLDAAVIRHADAYFVEDQFVALVDSAARSIPDDSRVIESDFPSETGWISFARSPVIDWTPDSVKTLMISDRVNDDAPYESTKARCLSHPPTSMFWLVRDGMAMFWVFADDFPAPLAILGFPLHDDSTVGSVPLEAWMKAFWLLLSQENVSETTPASTIPRAVRRRAANANVEPAIRVIRLPRRVKDTASSEHGEIDWQHRWIVSGHWRKQPWGPERSRIRPVWIAPYVKGPDDKPLKPQAHRLFVASAAE